MVEPMKTANQIRDFMRLLSDVTFARASAFSMPARSAELDCRNENDTDRDRAGD